ncbi:flagellar hook-associated protein FlgL [Catenuloplanes atrovinosus]|uniref:Flagellar hook-associated protein 3 FlgL n=1 Tax=Catenuloplanes atrovinosus TaxID=137266 RepID=A0AAE4CGA5_9ACTN|nr:flagellar hook-associated protein FlgL [Catenuloplanes atrovinosus]MDR7280500.1 flagellar hook-associated protein 3 FlgL [Catenuloplanes atrovinosus]
MAMQLRVTDGAITNRVLANLQGNLTRVGNLQEQLSSGKQISRPSDSPTGTVSAMQLRGESRAVQQYSRNASDGLGWLGVIDTALTSSLSQTGKVRELVLQGMSAGTASTADARAALAAEVENLRNSLIGVANTKYLDRPVFGGTTTGERAFDAAGSFIGDAGTVMRTVGDNSKVQVDANGAQVFGANGSGSQLFTVLDSIANNLRSSNTAGLDADLQNLDVAIGTIKTNLADVGARYNRIETSRTAADDRLLNVKSQLSEIEDIDLPNTIMQMQLQQTAYQAALQATAKVIQPSLMDFLR